MYLLKCIYLYIKKKLCVVWILLFMISLIVLQLKSIINEIDVDDRAMYLQLLKTVNLTICQPSVSTSYFI